MTHMFHRLADRVLRQSRTLRPVTPPVFAAVSAESDSTPSALPRPLQSSDTTLSRHRKTRQPQAADNPTRARATPAAPTVTTAKRYNIVSPPTSERLNASPDVAATDEPTSTAPPIIPSPVPAEPALTPAPMSEPQRPAPPAATQTPANTTVTADKVEPAHAPSHPKPAPPVTRLAPAVNLTPRTQRVERTPPPAPTIEVTIGRIEVRTQAPPPRPRPRRQPTLSLEAYAAERKAGRR
jgi:hypothetical protein